MKKLAILTSILALTACGGGSGGGAAPIMPDAPVVPDETKEIRNHNSFITGMVSVDNEAIRTSYVKSVLGEDYYTNASDGTIDITRGATFRASSSSENGKNVCKSERDCNQLAFDNMRKWLIENIDSLDENNIENSADLRKALMLAGFKDELPGNWDDIKEWFFANIDDIKQSAQDIYDNMGEHEEFNIRNVVFTMSSASLGDEKGGKDELTFDVKNGKIVGVDFKAYTPNETGKLVTGEGAFYAKRDGKNNKFLVEQIRQGEKLIGEMAIETYGQEIGLTYSDFGAFIGELTSIDLNNGDTKTSNTKEGFAGGYTTKMIDVSKMSGEMNFSGRVIGTVHSRKANNTELPLDGKATLNFDNGTETLSLDFSDWYDVQIVKNGNQGNIHFKNGGVISEQNSAYKFAGGDEFTTENFITGDYNGKVAPKENAHYGKINITYYGNTEKHKPIEATGVLQYVDKAQDNEIRANMAFGVVKQ